MVGHTASPPPVSSSQSSSKLPKFLNRQQRDRPKLSTGSQGLSSSTSPGSHPSSTGGSRQTLARKSSKILGSKERDEMPLPPTIVEPVLSRSRFTSSEPRPTSTISDNGSYNGGYSSASSSSRISDLPSRLSGWISHTLTGSSTDLSLPSILSQSQSGAASVSPKSKASSLLTAARHGKGHLDKAMRYILDSDAQPDKCPDPIWVMGVLHPGYEPPPALTQPSPSTPSPVRRDSSDSRRSPSSRRSSSSSSYSYSTLSTSPSTTSSKHSPSWPAAFYSDFTSRIWLTYRSHYVPIRDTALSSLDTDTEVSELSTSQSRRWNWSHIGEKTWTSDTGWGCMLRTGQSMLANALIHLHLSRDWRRPLHPAPTKDYVTYVKIITWFLDNPSPCCPFSVHRMAVTGKELGKDIGQWFGPSTAAGAIKRLVNRFPESQLAVSVAADGVIFDSDVYSASNPVGTSGHKRNGDRRRWGSHAVLVLVGIRLGIDGVNPIYYEGLKALFTFPQSVGIAGGRPSSSYYFVASQADSLFYLDPHHTRPTVTFRPSIKEDDGRLPERLVSRSVENNQHSSQSPSRTRSPTASNHHSMSPSPLSQEYLATITESMSDQDPVVNHYVSAYPLSELRTFHCDRVRKMPLSGLDPSMLLGFLCKDEHDYQDFRSRVFELCKNHKTMFSIQEEPPSWDDDSDDVGLESVSEPDMDNGQGDGEADASVSGSPSPVPPSTADSSSIDPVTPGPSTARVTQPIHFSQEIDPDVIIEDDDDEWVEPSAPALSPITEPTTTQEKRSAAFRPSYKTVTPGQNFPFPSSDDGEDRNTMWPSSRTPRERGESRPAPHLRSARAKDGGRTQSGGVKGIWMDSGDES